VQFFDLTKNLGYLMMPAGLFWLALLALALACLLRRRHRLGLGLLGLFVCYSVIGNCWVGQRLIASLERRIPQAPPAPSEPLDAICVLGGGSEPDPLGQPQLNDYGDRIVAAARLWHAGRTRRLVTSGSCLDTLGQRQDLGAETRRLWLDLGVPADAILVIPEPCRNTREEIAALRRLQARTRWNHLGLLSSAWHLPRALALADRAGLQVIPIGADWRGGQNSFQRYPIVPQARGFMLVQLGCWEYLGRWLGR